MSATVWIVAQCSLLLTPPPPSRPPLCSLDGGWSIKTWLDCLPIFKWVNMWIGIVHRHDSHSVVLAMFYDVVNRYWRPTTAACTLALVGKQLKVILLLLIEFLGTSRTSSCDVVTCVTLVRALVDLPGSLLNFASHVSFFLQHTGHIGSNDYGASDVSGGGWEWVSVSGWVGVSEWVHVY